MKKNLFHIDSVTKTLLSLVLILLSNIVLAQCNSQLNQSTTSTVSKACNENAWDYSNEVGPDASGTCFEFDGSGSNCGQVFNGAPLDLTCSVLCIDGEFSFDLTNDPDCPGTSTSQCTADGFAISFVDFGFTKGGSQVTPCNFSPSPCGAGGGLGYVGYQSTFTHNGGLIIEFDFYDNGTNDPSCDHIEVFDMAASGGSLTSLGQTCLNTALAANNNPYEDGATHSYTICIDGTTTPATLTISVDGVQKVSMSITLSSLFSSPSDVWFSVSSGWADGVVSDVCNSAILLDASNINFSARALDESVELSWVNFENLDVYYEIERSTNGVNFEPILSTKSKPNQLIYKYQDYNPNKGYNFYRVKETNANTYISTLSDVKQIKFNKKGLTTLFYNNILQVQSDEKDLCEVNVYNVSGELVCSNTLEPNGTLDLSGYDLGMYFVTISSATEKISRKILLTND